MKPLRRSLERLLSHRNSGRPVLASPPAASGFDALGGACRILPLGRHGCTIDAAPQPVEYHDEDFSDSDPALRIRGSCGGGRGNHEHGGRHVGDDVGRSDHGPVAQDQMDPQATAHARQEGRTSGEQCRRSETAAAAATEAAPPTAGSGHPGAKQHQQATIDSGNRRNHARAKLRPRRRQHD